MKAKLIAIALFLGSFGAIHAQNTQSYCPKEDVVVKCRKALVPYKYSNLVVNRIVFKRSNYIKEISIPLYYDARYRLVFNTELLPKDIKIKIYDKPLTEKKREELASFESSERQFNFEPDMENNKGLYEVYINFLIPAYIADDGSSFIKGCVILMTGYEDQVSEEFGDAGEGGE
jgi:hypothetical protein